MKEKHTGIGALNKIGAKNRCYGCTQRKVGCHSTCESYLAYKKAKDLEYAKQQSYEENESAHFRDGWQFRRKR